METFWGILSSLGALGLLVGSFFLLKRIVGGNDFVDKEKYEKIRKEKEDEIRKKPASNVVDDLDNADDVRSTIDNGKQKRDKGILNRLRNLFQGFGSKETNKSDNSR